MILAVPEQHIATFTPVGGPNSGVPYEAPVTWFHWWCSTCGRISKPRALFSHAHAALDMGERHEQREQCHDGQLSLFAIAGGAR